MLSYDAAFEALRPHVLSVALVAARIVPVTYLCPLFGGQVAPQTVRVALALALALHAHLAGGVAYPVPADGLDLVGPFARELLLGTFMAIVSALPFDAARMGGRMLDTFRGANGEASLPVTGSKEAATGDLLYQLLCALAFAGPGYRLVATAVLGSFRTAPLGVGSASDTGALLDVVLHGVATALATGLAIGAPALAVSLLVDVALGIAARTAPQLSIKDVGAPAKLLLGAALVLLCIGGVSQRLQDGLAESARVVQMASAPAGG